MWFIRICCEREPVEGSGYLPRKFPKTKVRRELMEMIAVGIIGGLVAAIFGFIDWLALPSNSRAKRLGGWHGIGNLIIVVMFIASWFLRRGADDFVPGTLALVLSFAGVALALITGWIGGELVYRLSVGVDPGANVNAPSSLSDQAASASKSRQTSART
jgi:hypothetical protein